MTDAAPCLLPVPRSIRKKASKASDVPGGSSSGATAAAGAAAAATEPQEVAAPTSSAYVRSLEEKLEHHRKIIRLYQNFSSLAIFPKEKKQRV